MIWIRIGEATNTELQRCPELKYDKVDIVDTSLYHKIRISVSAFVRKTVVWYSQVSITTLADCIPYNCNVHERYRRYRYHRGLTTLTLALAAAAFGPGKQKPEG
eukprot:2195696-Rhodomonas_salina.1